MAKSNTHVQRGKELANKLKSYSSKVTTEQGKSILKGALMIEGDAKRNCPVDTGYLRASLTNQYYQNAFKPYALVGTNTEYGPFVENGTSTQSPQPYLRPAFEDNIEEIQEDIKAAFKWG